MRTITSRRPCFPDLKNVCKLVLSAAFALMLSTCGGATKTEDAGTSPPAYPPFETLTALVVTPTSTTITWLTGSNTAQFVATGTFSDGQTLPLLISVLWSSTTDSVATIDNAGLVTPVSAGTTTIKATMATPGGVSGSATLTIMVPFLRWVAPVQYSDTTTIADGDLRSYRVHYSTQPGISSVNTGSYHSVNSPNTSVNPNTNVDIKDMNLAPATYYFAVTAVDLNGMESDFSNEVGPVEIK